MYYAIGVSAPSLHRVYRLSNNTMHTGMIVLALVVVSLSLRTSHMLHPIHHYLNADEEDA